MYATFNLHTESNHWKEHKKTGLAIHETIKSNAETKLDKFKNMNGDLEVSKIVDDWFPEINSDVFLSHSHKDKDLVVGLAGWLKDTFNINSFIDSTVWGYSSNLLKEIDNKYCMNATGNTYNYAKRNRSTSHVHTILSIALSTMIDKCECIIFVNTPNSFKPSKYFQDKGETNSPWIYSEITMTNMIRRRSPKEHRSTMTTDSAGQEGLIEAKKSIYNNMSYPLDLFNLTDLSFYDLNEWKNKEDGKKRKSYALDSLYKMKNTTSST